MIFSISAGRGLRRHDSLHVRSDCQRLHPRGFVHWGFVHQARSTGRHGLQRGGRQRGGDLQDEWQLAAHAHAAPAAVSQDCSWFARLGRLQFMSPRHGHRCAATRQLFTQNRWLVYARQSDFVDATQRRANALRRCRPLECVTLQGMYARDVCKKSPPNEGSAATQGTSAMQWCRISVRGMRAMLALFGQHQLIALCKARLGPEAATRIGDHLLPTCQHGTESVFRTRMAAITTQAASKGIVHST